MDKPRVGRPALADPADQIVKLRVTAGVRDAWTAAANRAGLSLSEWLRGAAQRELDLGTLAIEIRPDGDTWHLTAERSGVVLACGGIDLPLTAVDARLEDAAVQYAVDSGCGTVDQCQAATIRIVRSVPGEDADRRPAEIDEIWIRLWGALGSAIRRGMQSVPLGK